MFDKCHMSAATEILSLSASDYNISSWWWQVGQLHCPNWNEHGTPTRYTEISQSMYWQSSISKADQPQLLQLCTKHRCTVIFSTCLGALLVVVIFVDSVMLLFCSSCCWYLWLLNFPSTDLLPWSFCWLTYFPTLNWCTLLFSFCSSYTQGTLLYYVFYPWCVYVSSSIGFTITSFQLHCQKVKKKPGQNASDFFKPVEIFGIRN